jgi:hypothetical protein
MASSYQTRLGNAPEEGIKAPAAVATTTNIALTGEQLIEGINIVAGDRVLVRSQTDSSENGIYNASTTFWTRTHDWNAANDVINGVLVGDASTGTVYQAFFNGEFTPDSTDVIFQPSQVAALPVTEDATLTDGQTVVVFTNATVIWGGFFISGTDVDGGRLHSPDDYSYVSSTNTVTLVESYPNGTKITAISY